MGSFIDMTGQTINGIYVDSRAENGKDGSARWNCVCYCGNRFVTRGKDLRNGKTRSCGCYQRKRASEANIGDMIGKVFYGLTVIDKHEDRTCKDMLWLCRCECGNYTLVKTSNLISGGTKSCGCLKSRLTHERNFEDLTGQIFNSLYVESFDRLDKYGKCRWNARCLLCGNIAHPTTTTLKTGKSKTCGCQRMKNMVAARKVDLTDRRFEMLVAKYFIGTNNGRSLWYCECDCGCHTIASENDLMRGKITSCGCLRSRHERQIALWLDDHNIEYERQKTFDGCVNINPLRFDFYVSSADTVIEYDGEFHYMKIDGIDNDYEQQQINDKIKDDYCAEHNIRVLRIPYWEKDNIESILSDWFDIHDTEEVNSSDADLSA